MANLKHAIKQGIVALKAKNIQPVMQTVGDECLLKGKTALVWEAQVESARRSPRRS